MDVRNLLFPVAATPALQAILSYLANLKLIPLAHWEWNEDKVAPITYIVSTGSAVIATFLAGRKNKAKALRIAIGIIVLIIVFITYTYVSTNPPHKSWIRLYDFISYCTFFLTYISFGFVVAWVVKALSGK